ncbi:hypothetical protein A2780_03945 [Candidatus Daviesbacteria bacterium RIFCSPHIGHO2_01_FULL_41_45]|uniref:Uncharacterized protein n=1 Tax=Candidatus Yanofskybacteria bacterium RIFCSPLOWO2_02_FULL_45_10 TaxID=1802706 RepID=A0A1F8H5R4_9BACT|nr:MAG: hypothetical protein A2780_03945 [Candidatus Daviesbacteria bacterium RIFCSPHIGHO2_01_FULL_41_45]OGN32954.1 MAG: hypothetical protein A3I32_01390 [Candidatus Yanofskybacteria bacterium RIFCSPLOWO2_02_FULL_45_10]HCR81762.1 hypothetical protein [Candidatus Paceibacterota bacterium]
MTFERFIANLKNTTPLNFVILEEPVEITAIKDGHKHLAVALTTSSNGSDSFLYALVVNHDVKNIGLSILSRRGYALPREYWMDMKEALFHPWVQKWIASHPVALLQAGIKVGRYLAARSQAE